MFPSSLAPYIERAGLTPTPESARMIAAAVGLLVRHVASAPPSETLLSAEAVRKAMPALQRTASLPSSAEIETDATTLIHRAQAMSLQAPPTPRVGIDRARDYGDPHEAARRLCLLEDADDLLSVTVVLGELGRPVEPEVTSRLAKCVGRWLTNGISEATRWRIQGAAQVACSTRDLWTDPVGQALWVPVVGA